MLTSTRRQPQILWAARPAMKTCARSRLTHRNVYSLYCRATDTRRTGPRDVNALETKTFADPPTPAGAYFTLLAQILIVSSLVEENADVGLGDAWSREPRQTTCFVVRLTSAKFDRPLGHRTGRARRRLGRSRCLWEPRISRATAAPFRACPLAQPRLEFVQMS